MNTNKINPVTAGLRIAYSTVIWMVIIRFYNFLIEQFGHDIYNNVFSSLFSPYIELFRKYLGMDWLSLDNHLVVAILVLTLLLLAINFIAVSKVIAIFALAFCLYQIGISILNGQPYELLTVFCAFIALTWLMLIVVMAHTTIGNPFRRIRS